MVCERRGSFLDIGATCAANDPRRPSIPSRTGEQSYGLEAITLDMIVGADPSSWGVPFGRPNLAI